MINLRYHIISIVAVFLALGIGLALGSTFISSAVVSRLEGEIDQLRTERDGLREGSAELTAELETLVAELDQFEEAALPIVAQGRLDGSRVVLMAVEGVDDETIRDAEVALQGSAAEFVGTLWATGSFDLSDAQNREDLASVLGSSPNEVRLRRALQQSMAEALLPTEPPEEGSVVGDVLSDVTDELLTDDELQVRPPPARTAQTTLADLIEQGFLRFDGERANTTVPVGRLIVFGTRYLMVSAADVDVEPADFMLPVLRGMAASVDPVPAVAADATPQLPDSPGPVFVDTVRAVPELEMEVATQDNLVQYWGVMGATAALDQYPRVGHYGVAESAEAVLPPAA